MGNDGGSIPTRRELVKAAARNPTTSELKESLHEQQQHYWTHDPISRKPLCQPVVSDANGKLYNKDTILEYLVEGSRRAEAETETRGLVRGVRDVVELKFEVESEGGREAWKCPVTGGRLGPGSKAVYIVPCGHVFSATAIREVSGEKCLTCEGGYAANDVITILPTAETEVARLALRVKTLQEKGLAHSLKKAGGGGKKRKKRDEQVDSTAKDGPANVSDKTAKVTAPAPAGTDEGSVRINSSATASVAAKVREEQERSKKRKIENANVKSLFSNRDDSKHHGKSSDFMTRGFSLPAGAKR